MEHLAPKSLQSTQLAVRLSSTSAHPVFLPATLIEYFTVRYADPWRQFALAEFDHLGYDAYGSGSPLLYLRVGGFWLGFVVEHRSVYSLRLLVIVYRLYGVLNIYEGTVATIGLL